MKTLNNTLIAISISTVLLSASLQAQTPVNVRAVITETAEYQKSKKAGDELYTSLRENVPTATQNLITSNTWLKNSETTNTGMKPNQNWIKLDLNNDGSVLLDLPFSFYFFDKLQTSVWVNANGNLSFDQSLGHFKPELFPLNTQMIAPFWADIEASTKNKDAGIYILSSDNELRVLYRNMSLYNQNSANTITFEIILKADTNVESGNLAFAYHHVSPKLMESIAEAYKPNAPGYIIGINVGDSDNHFQIELFEKLTYLFNLADVQMYGVINSDYYVFNTNSQPDLVQIKFEKY